MLFEKKQFALFTDNLKLFHYVKSVLCDGSIHDVNLRNDFDAKKNRK